MQLFKSLNHIKLVADRVGLVGYLPYTLIHEVLYLTRCKLFSITPKLKSDIHASLWDLIRDIRIELWEEDSLRVIAVFGKDYNLRLIEEALIKGDGILSEIPSSFNYTFDVRDITENTKELLNITTEHIEETAKLPKELIEILTVSSGYGNFINTSKELIVNSTRMDNYASITKVAKHEYTYPWFNYKLAIKSFDIITEVESVKKSDTLIVGYFLDSFSKSKTIKAILKLLGAIILQYGDDINVLVYSFYGGTSKKVSLKSSKDVIEYFSQVPQMKLFPIDNSKALQTMLFENKGADILFVPNINKDCNVPSSYYGASRINILSFDKSRYNLKYANICKRSNGIFLTI